MVNKWKLKIASIRKTLVVWKWVKVARRKERSGAAMLLETLLCYRTPAGWKNCYRLQLYVHLWFLLQKWLRPFAIVESPFQAGEWNYYCWESLPSTSRCGLKYGAWLPSLLSVQLTILTRWWLSYLWRSAVLTCTDVAFVFVHNIGFLQVFERWQAAFFSQWRTRFFFL